MQALHVHISGLATLVTTLEVIVVLGTLALLAQKFHKTNTFWATVYSFFYDK